MHGDDVASAGISITTELVSKSSELIFELIKVAIDEQRQLAENYAGKLKAKELSGGEVSLKKLKKGGQIGMLETFEKADLKELIARAKELDIPVAVTENKGKSNTVSVFFNTKDQTALENIVADIREETKVKQKNPEQAYKMLTIEKSETEGFQMYCAEHDIPVTFMETKDEQVKCIFSGAYEQQMRKAIDNYHEMQKELADISVEVVRNKGRPKIAVTDMKQGKKLTMNFCTKARLERMLNERLGFAPYKAAEVTNVLAGRLTEDQKRFYYSGSRTLEQMEYFEKDIKFEDDNILTDQFTFAKFKQRNGTEYLTITDTDERFVVLSGKRIDRKTVEEQLRTYLNKKMYKDSWENVLGNCDSLLFLGGQEPTTLEHISKTLGKETIDTRSNNRTRGRNGSTSENDGILGRELMTVDELKVMKDNECILFVRGIFPFFCNKFRIERHPNYRLLEDADDKNAYLIGDVNTVKFGEDYAEEDLYSEPADDDENEEDNAEVKKQSENTQRSVPKENDEQDCVVENISLEETSKEQPHNELARRDLEMRRAAEIQAASIEKTDRLVTAEPSFIEVNDDNYLDRYDSDF